MKILFVADGRSPTALSWLRYWAENGHDVHLISSFPCTCPDGVTSVNVLPVAFSRMAGSQTESGGIARQKSTLVGILRDQFRLLRYYIGPFSLPYYQTRLQRLVTQSQPDMVHALRIPFEGMLSSSLSKGVPLVISTWGNDITLHARGSFLMSRLTRVTLERADGLISDTQRDIRLGIEWGFASGKPYMVVPGSGGVRLEQLRFTTQSVNLPEEMPDGPVIVNSRGLRPGSLRQDVFFQAIPLVAKAIPQAVFICPSLQGEKDCEGWVDRLGIRSRTKLWPRLTQSQLWRLFQASQVFVSPSVHDGTSNALLESMACGCFPVVGNIESMREWINHGENGFLVDATSASSIADAIIQAINQPALRRAAAQTNTALIAERAVYETNMVRVEKFYTDIILKR
jgi:glycosyltransferase involved in cell wall biosynthesis